MSAARTGASPWSIGAAVAVVAAIASLVFASGALGAGGDLTPLGCIDDNDSGVDTCATSVDGLGEARAVAISPDGKSVYAVADGDETLARFSRNLSTGALTYRGCIDGPFSPETCADTIPNGWNPVDVAVSPDGHSVYVASHFGDSGVYNFSRNTTNGALHYRNCVGDDDNPAACSRNMAGIGDPSSVALSADGKDLYLADFDADAVAHLRRNVTNGSLKPKGCVIETSGSPADPCAQNTIGLAAADSVAVSPDGKSVYAVGAFSDAIVRFSRNVTSGGIHPGGCVVDPDLGFESCAKTAIGLGRPEGVAVSPDNKSVYVAARDTDTLVRFDRGPAGGLRPKGCFVDNEFPTVPCGDSPKGLTGAHDVTVSPDGSSVYVASTSDAAVAQFARDGTGALNFRHCIKDDEATANYQTCPQSTDGLGGVTGVAVSPDNTSVYATAAFPDNAVVAFSRDIGP